MYVLTVALSKYTFIVLTLKLIVSRENVDSQHAKISSLFHMPCKLV